MIELLASDAIVELLAELPAGERAAVAAHVIGDHSYAQPADELGTSEAAVRQRLPRARETPAPDRRRDMSPFLDELRREVVTAHEAHAARSRAERTLRRRPPVPRIALGAALLAVLASIFAVLAMRERNETIPVAPRIVDELRIGGSPVGAVASDGSLWVADGAGRGVVRIDRENRRAVARIPVVVSRGSSPPPTTADCGCTPAPAAPTRRR
jgi:hypothetical protein